MATLEAGKRNIVVIGASAGGVEALTALFRSLPHDLPAAVFVVLHIPPHTASVLQRIISGVTDLRVLAATDNMLLETGTVYVGVADRHLMIDPDRVRVTRGPRECRVRPAIDVLFRSAAAAYGGRVVGVVLTGALDDGTAGLWSVKDCGGLAFVQEPSEAMHSSMPESAIRHVKVDFVGPLEALAHKISMVVGTVTQIAAPEGKPFAVESAIAAHGNGMEAGVMDLGEISRFTCPDCHGVLVQIEEGSIVRFRCHTGHAFSIKTLMTEVNGAIETGLWDTLRAIEERVMLLRQMAQLAERTGSSMEAARCRQQANDAEHRLRPLRELVLDPDFFGTEPAFQQLP